MSRMRNHQQDFTLFEEEIKKDRSVLEQTDTHGMGLIHVGIIRQLDNEWLLAMLSANPAAASLRCHGLLPLQMMLDSSRSVTASQAPVLEKMFQCYKPAARYSAALPLHLVLALRHFHSNFVQFVNQLLDEYPEATRIKASGSLPLHLALVDQKPFSMILKILETHPGAAVVADSAGMLPLQIAVRHHTEADLIKTIFEAFPGAVLRPVTSEGWTGGIFEYFARENVSEHVVRVFLDGGTPSPKCAACVWAALYSHFTEPGGLDNTQLNEMECTQSENRITILVRTQDGTEYQIPVGIHATGKLLKIKLWGKTRVPPVNQRVFSRRYRIEDNDKVASFWYGKGAHFDLVLFSPFIHAYIHSSLPHSIIMKILEMCPEYAMAVSEAGMLPLEAAIRNGRDPALVVRLFELFPMAAKEVSRVSSGDSLLRVALEQQRHVLTGLIFEAKVDELGQMLPLDPAMLAQHGLTFQAKGKEPGHPLVKPDLWDPSGILKIEIADDLRIRVPMLHVAIEHGASARNLQLLIDSGYPVAAINRSTQETALDVAIARNVPDDVFDLVLEEVKRADGDCLTKRGVNGKTVLHRALEGKPNINVVRRLCAGSFESLAMMDHDGRYPIHCAAMCGADTACIREVLLPNPAPLGEADHRGFTPLQLAVISEPEPGVVYELISMRPDVARTRDRAGNSLLRQAMLENAPPHVIQEIVDGVPEALDEVNVLDRRWTQENAAGADIHNKVLSMRRVGGEQLLARRR